MNPRTVCLLPRATFLFFPCPSFVLDDRTNRPQPVPCQHAYYAKRCILSKGRQDSQEHPEHGCMCIECIVPTCKLDRLCKHSMEASRGTRIEKLNPFFNKVVCSTQSEHDQTLASVLFQQQEKLFFSSSSMELALPCIKHNSLYSDKNPPNSIHILAKN